MVQGGAGSKGTQDGLRRTAEQGRQGGIVYLDACKRAHAGMQYFGVVQVHCSRGAHQGWNVVPISYAHDGPQIAWIGECLGLG